MTPDRPLPTEVIGDLDHPGARGDAGAPIACGCQARGRKSWRPGPGRSKVGLPMMWFSKKAVYAMQALTALARDAVGKPRQVQELAEREGIPVKFLEQILLGLKRQGILHSKRGVGGGYQLARRPDTITLVEVLESVDGPFQGQDFPPLASKGLVSYFSELNGDLRERLQQTTIADILARASERESLSFDI